MKKLACIAMLTGFASPAFADGHVSGDVANGEAQFGRQCVACHVVRDDMGEVLAGRSAKAGPNLCGIAGAQLGSAEGFRYGDSLTAAGEADLVWTQDAFAAYVQDPTKWLRDALEDRRARSKMGYKMRSEQEALDIYAYLSSLAK